MTTPLIAGNWKMNGTLRSLTELKAIADAVKDGKTDGTDVVVCPPATMLSASRGILHNAAKVGGQDCHAEKSGAHTGDIAAEMLKDIGASYVIVGHSERRADHAETDAMVRAKVEAAWRAGLIAIVCIGESQGERDEGRTLDRLGEQLSGSLPDGARGDNLVVAYEPIWAIGTGRTPTVENVAEVHDFLRNRLKERFGEATGSAVKLLYGGSVKPDNAFELLHIDNVDGALVGGASLKAADFVAICEAAARPQGRDPFEPDFSDLEIDLE
ncbi:triose-phosphate isomerase [Fulvimarina sp. 2208YS6-2-32]|uniref:Triosephosphate isomerase n=1 Tax=Fulvimarina uroteuthidis TaxID=3098149 RepID=A0ABU5HZU7_9HYPH|nr:triose-phosphate isomerase [Fulvimarina sp. 2208YS6-2-32]MDY8108659.1 triose-phosphate isomerase [Fulvimarina sp. 2208YS6-2-32]